MELLWLALWPRCGNLSHSHTFNAAIREHPIAADVYPRVATWLSIMQPRAADDAEMSAAIVFTTSLALLGGAYVTGLCLLAWPNTTPRGALVIVLGAAALFQATLAWMPGIFSQDVFSYIAYGRLAAIYDLNPYIWPPSAMAKDVALPWVAEVWRTYPAPYGPVWLDVQSLLAARLASWSMADQALAYRALGDVL